MNGHSFRRFKPLHLAVCRLHWSQPTMHIDEIAAQVGCAPSYVSFILNSADAKEICDRLVDKTLDTLVDVQTDLQAVAPLVLQEKIRLSLDQATPVAVRSHSLTEILHMAGHQPTKVLQVQRADPATERLGKLSESQIMDELLKGLGSEDDPSTDTGGNGPDGRPLQ